MNPRRSPQLTPLLLLLLAAVVTGLNAAKPMRVDDTVYFQNARQIAAHPADPYGYDAFWVEVPMPGNFIAGPPVMPYWWAIAIRLFGPDAVVAWKLWLFPWVACLAISAHALARRFAGDRVALPLTAAVLFSPAVLPGLNLMLDVPALGIGLCGVCLGLSAVDRRSIGRAVAAGVVLGLAMQTKYSMVTLPAAVFGYALVVRCAGAGSPRPERESADQGGETSPLRWRHVALAAVPGLVAAGLFVAWEAYTAHLYGKSHFLYTLGWVGPTHLRGANAMGLLSFFGGLMVAIGAVAAAAAGLPAGVTVAIGAAAIALAGAAAGAGMSPDAAKGSFDVIGAGTWIAAAACAWRLLRRPATPTDRGRTLFLLGWLILEAAAAVYISPYPATRRYIGTTVVMTLLVGRAVAAMPSPPVAPTGARRWRPDLVAFWVVNLALGLIYWAADRDSGLVEQRALRSAKAIVDRGWKPGETVWFTGHWGLQFYAEQAGYRPLVAGQSAVHQGDWIVLSTHGVSTQHMAPRSAADFDVMGRVAESTGGPLSTNPYYGSDVPIERQAPPAVKLMVLRVRHDFTPAAPK